MHAWSLKGAGRDTMLCVECNNNAGASGVASLYDMPISVCAIYSQGSNFGYAKPSFSLIVAQILDAQMPLIFSNVANKSHTKLLDNNGYLSLMLSKNVTR